MGKEREIMRVTVNRQLQSADQLLPLCVLEGNFCSVHFEILLECHHLIVTGIVKILRLHSALLLMVFPSLKDMTKPYVVCVQG